jgi:hypothetical protein
MAVAASPLPPPSPDILVPRHSPAGVFLRHINFVKSRLKLADQSEATKDHDEVMIKSKAYRLLVLQDYQDRQEQRQKDIKRDLVNSTLQDVYTGVKQQGSQEVEEILKVGNYDPNDFIATDAAGLFWIHAFLQCKIEEKPGNYAETKFADDNGGHERVDKHMGVDAALLPGTVRLEDKLITFERLQRAFKGTWVVSDGPHNKRFDQVMILYGCPFMENVLRRHCQGDHELHEITGLFLGLDQNYAQRQQRDVYVCLSLRHTLEVFANSYKTLLSIRRTTKDDLL